MSTTTLPTYPGPPPAFSRTPTYTAEPQAYEQRLAWNAAARPRPAGQFVKQSKALSLRLHAQEDKVTLPVYGCGAAVEGAVELTKTEGISSVEVKIEGNLKLREIGEGGTTSHRLCLSKEMLWSRQDSGAPCPSSLAFSLALPTTYSDGRATYPLPPTYHVHMSGVPGFNATIEYSVSAAVQKSFGRASSLLRLGNENAVSTPFVYNPRSRPAVPPPRALRQSLETFRFVETPEWRRWETSMQARSPGAQDIRCQLYLPAARVYAVCQPIPFYLTFESSSMSLNAFLPYGPSATLLSPHRQFTRVKLLRQSTVDVRNALILGTKTDIWRVDTIGEGTCRHSGDAVDWIAFSGEIAVHEGVAAGSFKVAGLTVKDFVELTMVPPDPLKAPFNGMRVVVPVKLTTDAWSNDGTVTPVVNTDSDPSTPAAW